MNYCKVFAQFFFLFDFLLADGISYSTFHADSLESFLFLLYLTGFRLRYSTLFTNASILNYH